MFYIRRKIKYTLRRNVGFLRLTTVFEGSREEWKGGAVTYSSSVNWLAPMSNSLCKNKNVAGPKLVVRFDGKPFDVSRLVREVHSALKKEPKLRSLSTVGIGE